MAKKYTMADALKRATVGLIGDGQKTVSGDKLYRRVVDQCKRYGIYAPSRAKYIDLLRAGHYRLYMHPDHETITVYLFKRGKLGRR